MKSIRKSYKIILLVWCMILYGFIHAHVESFFLNKLDFLEVVYEAFTQSVCLQSLTSICILSAWIVWTFASIKDRNISQKRCLLDAIGIEVLLLANSGRETLGSGFGTISLLSLVAIVLVLDIFVCGLKWLAFQKYDEPTMCNESFVCDNHDIGIIDGVRKKYAEYLLRRLRNVDNKEEAFSLVVYGEWGSGKTMFLKCIEDKLRNQGEIIFNFNPWNCNSEKLMLNCFFDDLGDVLSEYDSSLMKPMIEYVDLLTSLDMPKPLDVFASSVFGKGETSVNKLKDEIRESLCKIGKSVYILIDDLDRLTKSEIYEVIRLIRNTANFPYLKFIVACDRKYIVAQLKELNMNPKYLEKIFTMEVSLPKMYQDYPCVNRLKEVIVSMADDVILNRIFELMPISTSELLEKSLGNLRQAERFARSLVLNWTFTKDRFKSDKIDIRPDEFFWIELIRVIDAKLYEDLQFTPYVFFEIKQNREYGQSMYVLKSNDLAALVENNCSINILNKVFPYNNYSKPDCNTIALLENYDKYFCLGKAPGTVSMNQLLQLLNIECKQDEFEKLIDKFEHKERQSILNRLLMFDTKQLTPISKLRFIDFIFVFYGMYKDDKTDKLLEKLLSLLQSKVFQEKEKNYLLECLEKTNGEYSQIISSNNICNKILQKQTETDKEFIEEQKLENIIRNNFMTFVTKHECDAGSILNESSAIHDIVESSVVSSAVIDIYGSYAYTSYNAIIHKQIIDFFSTHKSKRISAIRSFETINADNDAPQELYDALIEKKETEKKELFGSTDNYEEFKEKCFEQN